MLLAEEAVVGVLDSWEGQEEVGLEGVSLYTLVAGVLVEGHRTGERRE